MTTDTNRISDGSGNPGTKQLGFVSKPVGLSKAVRAPWKSKADGFGKPSYNHTRRLVGHSLVWTVGIPLLVLGSLTVVFRTSNLDLAIAGLFYDESGLGWKYLKAQPWKSLEEFGELPGVVLGAIGLVFGSVSLFWKRLQPYGRVGFFCGLMVLLGPGLIVNAVMKPGWLRPRPNHVVDFGGKQQFVAVGGMGSNPKSMSFPCGHAAMGFVLIAPAFLMFRRHRAWAAAIFVAGMAYGGIIGLTRIVQGKHFASDVVWSCAIVYFMALALAYVFERFQIGVDPRSCHSAPRTPRRRAHQVQTAMRIPNAPRNECGASRD